MKVTVFGTRTWEMMDERSNEIRRGITAHYTTDSLNSSVRGLEYGKFSVPIDSPMYGTVQNMQLPAELKLEFNRYGKVSDFEIVEK